MNVSLYPYEPGAKVPGTSTEAAVEMKGRAGTLRMEVLKEMRRIALNHGWTADEMAGHLSESVLSIRPRFSELQEMGLIIDSGRRRQNLSGRNAVVWVLSDPQTRLF